MQLKSLILVTALTLAGLITQPAIAGNNGSCADAKGAKAQALHRVNEAISQHGRNSRQAYEAIREYATIAHAAAKQCGSV